MTKTNSPKNSIGLNHNTITENITSGIFRFINLITNEKQQKENKRLKRILPSLKINFSFLSVHTIEKVSIINLTSSAIGYSIGQVHPRLIYSITFSRA